MAHHIIDGVLVVAKLKRGLFGGAVYTDVTIREADGAQRNLGTLMVLDDMKPAMVPGSRGRFYFHDVLGTKGIHGFRLLGGQAHSYFPVRMVALAGVLGLLNLLMALGWWLLEGGFAPFATGFGLATIGLAVMYLFTRGAAMQAFRADEPGAREAAKVVTVPA